MNKIELKKIWQSEENIAHIKGWDFSHIKGLSFAETFSSATYPSHRAIHSNPLAFPR